MKVCIQSGWTGREALAIRLSAEKLGYSIVRRDFPMEGEVAVGTVEFCMEAFGPHGLHFFPSFLRGWLRRNVCYLDGALILDSPTFVKDGAAWKSDWKSRVYPAGESLPFGAWCLSDPVVFTQEWRYYVANGDVVTTGWYDGEDEDETAPELGIEWPDDFSGAVDFGRLDTGEMALVEAHAPFACGWYGERHEDYARWQIDAWKACGWWKRLDEPLPLWEEVAP